MDDLFTAAEVAAKLKTTPGTVRRVGRTAKIGRKIGTQRLFAAEDISALAGKIKPGPGNPNMVPGNYFGRPEKPKKKIRK